MLSQTDLHFCKSAWSVNAKNMIELKVVGEDFVLFVITAVVQDGPITRL